MVLIVSLTQLHHLPPLVCVVVVDAACQHAGIRSIDDVTVLPIFVVHQITLEVEGVVDVAKAKLNVVVLQLVS